MASTDGTNFKRSLVQFQSSLTEVEEQRLKDANLKDVEASIKKIQVKLGREKRLCNLNRIKKFLDAMKHVEDLVAIFLNVSEFVAFIWGPIKLALMVATTWANSIKQLLDVYEDIGEALSNLNFFHELIKSKEHIKQAMEDYFSHILRFHRCVLNVFSQDDWKAFFKTTLGGFRHKVEPIIQALKRRQEKLSHERLQAHAIHEGVQNSREHADGRFDTLAADLDSIKSSLASESLRLQTSAENREMKESLEDKLNISKFGSHSRLDSPEPSSSSAGDWIFHHPDFQAWEKATSSQRNVLFLNGSPGAGKTILAMKIIRYLTGKDPIHGSTVYFFFRHDDDDRKSAKSMLRAILSQLIEQDETIMRHLYEKSSRMSRSLELSRLRTLQGLAQDSVKICAKFKRTPEQGEKLAAEVAKTSKGMFLYAKVVMSNFLSMCTIKEFENEMRSSTVPEDLDQA
ncbi:hypothetical protein CEP54_014884 [Fusarium duplospermum]|uniref:Uncharacterized protein n=1 Tax=Fusarium duplospermum TaxID=1325734 RepID=A0A428NT02_9HYPO|nr:hypothetical protein CEP54_014884 [Fusarium duplospermum]